MTHPTILDVPTSIFSFPPLQKDAPTAHDEQQKQVAALLHEIEHVHSELARQSSLEPCEVVNALFTQLVTFCIRPYPLTRQLIKEPLFHVLTKKLQPLCSEGEFRLERHWARRICDGSGVEEFPYYGNYVDLTRMEVHALEAVAGDRVTRWRRAVFIGSGPLPLTSILLQKHFPDIRVDNVDLDSEACKLGAGVAQSIGVQEMNFHNADALDYEDLRDADLVILAALVGKTREEKRRFVEHLSQCTRSGTYVLLRSAHGLRTLLYPVVEPEDLETHFRTLLVVHPHTNVVNSVVVAQRL
ncbi:uncharacterized protein VTP21DRAFT_1190 [Calcarisporiella thermophila]|uniref:uncharacterized protein n=1 Tax=Calcarisporiella thermophila TaxID=911321 RepID=UPI003742D5D4